MVRVSWNAGCQRNIVYKCQSIWLWLFLKPSRHPGHTCYDLWGWPQCVITLPSWTKERGWSSEQRLFGMTYPQCHLWPRLIAGYFCWWIYQWCRVSAFQHVSLKVEFIWHSEDMTKISRYHISPFHRLELGDHASGCHSSPGLAFFALIHGFSTFCVCGAAGAVSGEVCCVGAALAGVFKVASFIWVVGGCCWVLGLSRKEALLAQRSSASRASCLICAWRTRSCCCSWILGGCSRTCRSHWCHCAVLR